MNADQKQRAKCALTNWLVDDMAALLQELAESPETEPVARVTGYYAGYLSIATVDGRVLPAGTALYLAPPAPIVPDGWRIVPYTPTVQMLERAAYAVNNRPQPSKYEPSATPAIIFWTAMLNCAPESVPDMPLSMEQFGGLVGLARDDASEKAIVYKATNIYGETCYFGVKSTAQAWAKSGSVDEVRLRDLKVVAAQTPAEAPADVARDAWYGSNPPSLFQATAIYMALLEAAQNPQKLSAERILELFDEHSKPDRWPFGFARAIDREILGGGHE